mmetsp:Transcript_18462/g.33920  ORF Transcript_18462/g.33920 Transcript_18462/m.33920 type:complete len:323 (-) Transcript_18462:83-1051(-)
MLAPALTMKDFDTFTLEGNEFVNVCEGINFALGFIKNNPGLGEFGWVNNEMGSMDNVNRLLQALKPLPYIHLIQLKNCCGESVNGYDILRSFLTGNKHFKDIDLSSNSIRTAGGTHLSDYLATDPPLERLSLEDNMINDNDATLIAEALKRNTSLKHLSLERNAITDVGCNALRNTLFDATSLNSVADSNHTCYIRGLGLGFGDVAINDVTNSKDNRRRKIYSLLSSRHNEETNSFHLDQELGNGDDGYSLKLVPKVLECVHLSSEIGYREYLRQEAGRFLTAAVNGGDVQENDAVTPLSVMYEILRSWKIPEMYEHRGVSS